MMPHVPVNMWDNKPLALECMDTFVTIIAGLIFLLQQQIKVLKESLE